MRDNMKHSKKKKCFAFALLLLSIAVLTMMPLMTFAQTMAEHTTHESTPIHNESEVSEETEKLSNSASSNEAELTEETETSMTTETETASASIEIATTPELTSETILPVIDATIAETEILQPILPEESTSGGEQAGTMSVSQFWIEDAGGNRVYEAVLRPGQSIFFGLHNWMTFALSSNAVWTVSPGSGRGSVSPSQGKEVTFTAGSTTGTATLTSTLNDGTSYSIKIYITKRLDIIRPASYTSNPYGAVSYEHVYVGDSKPLRGNTVENRESNSDLLAYWTTGGHDDLVSRAWSDSRKCWTTQTITGLKAGTFNLAIKATTQNSVMAQIPVTVIDRLSPNRLGFVKSAQYMRMETPTTTSSVKPFRGAVVTVKGEIGNYWYVKYGNSWGFLPKSSVNDYPFATYSGFGHDYYFNNRDLALGVTSFKSGTSAEPNAYSDAASIFLRCYTARENEYRQISDRTGVPAKLIAAIHFREAGGNIEKSIRDGSDLNERDFVEDAVDAINNSGGRWLQFKQGIGMGANTANLLAMLQFAEFWNGTGCADNGRINPYLYSGSNIYTKGKYTSDGVWDPNFVDKQPGVFYLLSQVY